MEKRIISVLLGLLMIVTLVPSCKKSAAADQSFSYPISGEPACLDPQIAYDEPSFVVMENCMEGLIREENGTIRPAAAKSYTLSADETAYTFQLRENAVWHVSKEIGKLAGATFDPSITAADFIFGMMRALNPAHNLSAESALFSIRGAKNYHEGKTDTVYGLNAVNSHTLEILLEKPDKEFLQGLASPECMPCSEAFFNITKGRYGLESKTLLCNGPFYLSRWSHGDSLGMRRNPNYNGENQAVPSAVTLYIDPDKKDSFEKFRDGIYDVISLSGKNYKDAEALKDVTLMEYYSLTWALVFNQKNQYLQNKDIRNALCYSVDRSLFPDLEFFTKATGLIPPASLSSEQKKYREEARQDLYPDQSETAAPFLYQRAVESFKPAKIPTLTILCADDVDIKLAAGYILQSWQKVLGVFINLQSLPMEDLLSKVKSGNYEMAFFPLSAKSDSALSMLSQFSSHAEGNVCGYQSDRFDEVIGQIRNADNDAAKLEKLKFAEKYIIIESVVYPVYFEATFYALAKGVSGISVNPFSGNVNFISARKSGK